MSSIFLIITGGILLMAGEMLMISAGLISISVIIAIEIYNRVSAWKFISLFLFVSIAIDAYFGYLLGTYYLSIVLAVLFHSVLKRILPYDRLPIRLFVLFLSFASFHISRNILISIQLGSFANLSIAEVLIGSFIRAAIESVILVGISYILDTYFGKSLTSVKVNL